MPKASRRPAESQAANPRDLAGETVHYERAVLGSVIEQPKLLRDADDLAPEDFLLTDHQHIWRAMRATANLDLITLTVAVAGNITPAYLSSLLDGVVPENFRTYVDAVHNARREREYQRLAKELAKATRDEERVWLVTAMQELLAAMDTGSKRIQRFDDIPDVFSIPVQESTSLVDGLLDASTLTMWSGEAGVGKSFLALRLAISLALGGTFLGRRASQTPVLLLDRENPVHVVRKRLSVLAGGPVPNMRVWGSWLADPPSLIGDPRLLAMARELRPVLIFDSFVRFHAADENSSGEMKVVMANLRALTNAGATVLLLHHRPKAQFQQYRGSSDILAAVDAAYAVEYDEDAQELTLASYKCRDGAKQTIAIRTDFKAGTFEATDVPQEPHDSVGLLRSIIEAQPGISQNQIRERSGLRREDVYAILAQKIGQLWRVEIGQRGAKHYFPFDLSRDLSPTCPRPEALRPVPESDATCPDPCPDCTGQVEGDHLSPTSLPLYRRGEGEVAHPGQVRKVRIRRHGEPDATSRDR